MTQTTMTQGAVPPSGLDAGPVETDSGTTGDRRRQLLLLGGVAVVGLGTAGYFLLSGGGSSSATALGPVPRGVAHVATAGTTVAKTAAKAPSMLPVVSSARLGRDPFKPLYIEPAAAPAAAPAAPAATSTAPGGTSTAPATSAPKTYPMTLTKVSSGTAEFVIDGKLMLAKPGSIFGPTSELKLLSLSQNPKGAWVATVQVGDAQPFDAVQNQKVFVN